MPAGPHSVTITATGDLTPVLTVDVDLADGVKYSAVAYDYLANISALALVDDDSNIDPMYTRLQITHAAADVGQVDLWSVGPMPVLLLENVDFGATSTLDLPAGAGPVGIDVDDDMVPDMVFEVPDLGAGNFVDVYAVNEDGGSPVFLLAHLPDGSTARVDQACGDNVAQAWEVCDGTDLDSMTCVDFGYSSGELACSATCDAYVEDACIMGDWGDDFEAGAVLGAEWVLGGDANWFGSGTMPHAGSFNGECGDIGDGQTSSMEVSLNFVQDGLVDFWYRVSSETNWDYLRFYIDNVQQNQWSGVIGWTQQTYPIAAGAHTLRWAYTKDGSLSANADTVWVDDITTVNGQLP